MLDVQQHMKQVYTAMLLYFSCCFHTNEDEDPTELNILFNNTGV